MQRRKGFFKKEFVLGVLGGLSAAGVRQLFIFHLHLAIIRYICANVMLWFDGSVKSLYSEFYCWGSIESGY